MRAAWSAIACATAVTATAQVVITTPNLLTNPGAETGSLAGWTIIGGPQTTVPSVDSGTYDPGYNPHTGLYQFVGDHYPGGGGAQGYLKQTVDVSWWSSSIDLGGGRANLSFWEHSYDQGNTSDYAHVMLTYLDSGGVTLGSAASPDFSSRFAWTNFTGTYAIPAGTRSIVYTMSFYRANNGGSYIDSFLDDNLLTVTVPEPASTALAGGLALATLGIWRRQRRAVST